MRTALFCAAAALLLGGWLALTRRAFSEEWLTCNADCGVLDLPSPSRGLVALSGAPLTLHAHCPGSGSGSGDGDGEGEGGLFSAHHKAGATAPVVVSGLPGPFCPQALAQWRGQRLFAVSRGGVEAFDVTTSHGSGVELAWVRRFEFESAAHAASITDVAATGPDSVAVTALDGGLFLSAEGTARLERLADVPAPSGVTLSGDSLFVSASSAQEIWRVSRATGALLERVPVDAFPGHASTALDGSVWVAAAARAAPFPGPLLALRLTLDPASGAAAKVVTALAHAGPGGAVEGWSVEATADSVLLASAASPWALHCALGPIPAEDMPLRWSAADPSTAGVSLTAFMTNHVWVRHGLSPAEMYTVTGHFLYALLSPVSTACGWLGLDTLEDALLYRHAWIDERLDAAIADGRVGQVLELASGLTGRGMRYAARGVPYVETDLPGMVSRKRNLVHCAGGGGSAVHHLVDLDVLDPASFARVLDGLLDPELGTAVVAEGLFTYFPPETVEEIWGTLHAWLEKRPHSVFLGTAATDKGANNPVARPFMSLVGLVTGRNLQLFEDAPAVQAALERSGFDVPELDRASMMALFHASTTRKEADL